jgi:hypothetical protein
LRLIDSTAWTLFLHASQFELINLIPFLRELFQSQNARVALLLPDRFPHRCGKVGLNYVLDTF